MDSAFSRHDKRGGYPATGLARVAQIPCHLRGLDRSTEVTKLCHRHERSRSEGEPDLMTKSAMTERFGRPGHSFRTTMFLDSLCFLAVAESFERSEGQRCPVCGALRQTKQPVVETSLSEGPHWSGVTATGVSPYSLSSGRRAIRRLLWRDRHQKGRPLGARLPTWLVRWLQGSSHRPRVVVRADGRTIHDCWSPSPGSPS